MDLRFQGNEHLRFADAVGKLGSERAAVTAYRRAINKVGDKAKTQVRRALAKQVGLSQGTIEKLGRYRTKRATARGMAYEIATKGNAIPLRYFGAKQFSFGVRAKPWGKSQRFPGTFIFAGTPRSGRTVGAAGDVFHRRTSASLPIEKMFGPAIPVEMVKGDSADVFHRLAGGLPKRIEHEVRVMTDGVVTRG